MTDELIGLTAGLEADARVQQLMCSAVLNFEGCRCYDGVLQLASALEQNASDAVQTCGELLDFQLALQSTCPGT